MFLLGSCMCVLKLIHLANSKILTKYQELYDTEDV